MTESEAVEHFKQMQVMRQLFLEHWEKYLMPAAMHAAWSQWQATHRPALPAQSEAVHVGNIELLKQLKAAAK